MSNNGLQGAQSKAMTSLVLNETEPASPLICVKPIAGETHRQMSRAVAHDLNNLLTIIHGYAERLLQKPTDETRVAAQLKLIRDAARSAAVVVRDASGLNLKPGPNSQSPAK